jgi:predicted peptidase
VKSTLLALVLLASCSPDARFLERSVTVHGHTYAYRVWLPPRFTKLRRWPVILFLHGSGESGDDNVRQLTAGLPALLTRDPSRYRAIVVMPQCRRDHEWYGEMEEQALAALEQSIVEFRGDRRRVIVTGISLGGAGAWYFARHSQQFAAVVPVCGEVVREPDDPFPLEPPPDLAQIVHARDPFAALAARIGKTPVWAFHGANDPVIHVEQTRKMVSALRAHGGDVRYTEYAGRGHDIWDTAYSEAALPKWMLAQRH